MADNGKQAAARPENRDMQAENNDHSIPSSQSMQQQYEESGDIEQNKQDSRISPHETAESIQEPTVDKEAGEKKKEGKEAGEKGGFVKKSWKEIAAERREQLKEITDRLEAGVKEYMTTDDQFRKVLETMAKFHHYSANNALLIAMQMPTATHVASYTNWQKKFNRQVKKGQKGLSIIAPAPYKKKTEREVTNPATGRPVLDADGNPKMEEVEITVPRYKVVKAFDVSQTFGDPLPELNVPELTGSVENYEMFMDAIRSVSPVPIRFDKIETDAKGYYDNAQKEIVIKEGMSQNQTMKTTVHEVSHARLHDRDKMRTEGVIKSQQQKELEAESIAYTVLFYYKLTDSSPYTFPYLASWSASQDTRVLRQSMDTIRRASSEIIDEVDAFMAERMKEREMSKEQDADRFTIYQIRDGSPAKAYSFMNLEFVKTHNYAIRPEYYQEVYQAGLSPEDTLEGLYAHFNQEERPSDYKGHSLSVSDIVVLHKGGEDHAYYVDSFGFTEVPEFLVSEKTMENQLAENKSVDIPPEEQRNTTKNHQAEKQSIESADKIPPEEQRNTTESKQAEQRLVEQRPPKEQDRHDQEEPRITFCVAECVDFPVMGAYYDGLTFSQAAELYQKMPDSHMHGGKGIICMLHDEENLAAGYTLIMAGKVQENIADTAQRTQDAAALKAAITEAKSWFPEHATERTAQNVVTEQPLRAKKEEPFGRKESVLAALRKHQKSIRENSENKGREERSHTPQSRKGELAI